MNSVSQLTIRQGDFMLRDIHFEFPDGAYGILMGPTGCGKTTLLEAICGLRRIERGRIVLRDRDVTRLPAAQREIGYVPQEAVLFPAMRVDRQIEFALTVRKVKRRKRKNRVLQLAELLHIDRLLYRYPHGLSGGEKQRVALARALSFRPRLLCLDEPLSALDQSTRGQMIKLLGAVYQNEKVTVMHITHNASEGKRLGTHLFRFVDGTIESTPKMHAGSTVANKTGD